MIIEQPFKANDTITIKTLTDEVVARFVEEDANTITIQKPLSLMATQQGIGLGPYAFTIDPNAKLKINKSTVIFVTKTESQMASQYMASTSGIKTVSAGEASKFQL